MPKEFDIFVRNRIHECTLTVTSLTYHDFFSVVNRMFLESRIRGYILSKILKCKNRLEIGTTASTFAEKFGDASSKMEFGAAGTDLDNLETRDGKAICAQNGKNIILESKSPYLAVSAEKFGDASSNIEIGATASTFAEKFGDTNSMLEFGIGGIDLDDLETRDGKVICTQSGQNIILGFKSPYLSTLKYTFEQPCLPSVIGASISDVSSEKFIGVSSEIDLRADVKDLCYLLVLEENPINLPIEIMAVADAALRRCTSLNELDDNTLEMYDDMLLDDLYYTIV